MEKIEIRKEFSYNYIKDKSRNSAWIIYGILSTEFKIGSKF